MNSQFTKELMAWNQNENAREMPWKGEKNPYRIWLSEIILQQTRVEQGTDYYNRFIKKYPTVSKLAAAPDNEVFKLWEGLGYYNRCRNLLFTARTLVEKNKGIFPKTYDELLALKGVGPYTAAAIASFAYNLPYAVVDGNVFRVLSRYFGIDTPIDTTAGKQAFTSLAEKMLHQKAPGTYNQAIMDFGATVCKPALPNCAECPLQKGCAAYQTGKVNQLPVKEKVLTRTKRHFNYFVFEWNDKIWVRQRVLKDVWQGLHEFYLLETPQIQHWATNQVSDWLKTQLNIKQNKGINISSPYVQQLTHQQIRGVFIRIKLTRAPGVLASAGNWYSLKDMSQLAFPKLITQYMEISFKS